MNTTYYWRANASNLLSMDFLQIVRSSLSQGGVCYYNTTWSDAAQTTAMAVFPYALRVANFIAASDSPIMLDKLRWQNVLTSYRSDGRPVFTPSDPKQKMRVNEVLNMDEKEPHLFESRQSMLERLKGTRLITDDNMGEERSH